VTILVYKSITWLKFTRNSIKNNAGWIHYHHSQVLFCITTFVNFAMSRPKLYFLIL